MSHITKIIRYFFYHSTSEKLTERVHRRLCEPADGKEKEEALQEVWEEIGFPDLASGQMQQALSDIERRIGFQPSVQGKKERSPTLQVPVWFRIAAIWLIPLLTLGISYYMYKEAESMKSAVSHISFVEYYVPVGQREQITLPDSSKVWLNAGTLLIYPTVFAEGNREVYLSGEGYFDVRKSLRQPFVVKTNLLNVEVLGTKFNLSAYPQAEKVTTTLEQGSVRILLHNPSLSEHSFVLKPDERLSYIPATGAVEKSIVKAADYSDWREGGLMFNQCSFMEILNTLERTYQVKIHLLNSSYSRNSLTIHFDRNESIENIMMLVKEMIPELEYRIVGKELYIQ